MEYKGKEISSLKDLNDIITEEVNMESILTRLGSIPSEVGSLLNEQSGLLGELREIMELMDKLNNPLSQENLIAITKQLYPSRTTTDAEAELMLKEHKKTIKSKAVEIGVEGIELLNNIKEFYLSCLNMDYGAAEESGKKMIDKLKGIFGNGNLKTGGKKLARNLGISAAVTAFASWLLGLPIGSAEFFAVTGLGSAGTTAILPSLEKLKDKILRKK